MQYDCLYCQTKSIYNLLIPMRIPMLYGNRSKCNKLVTHRPEYEVIEDKSKYLRFC